MSSDYFYLEDVYRMADIATRDNTGHHRELNPRFQRRASPKQQFLAKAAEYRKTNVRFMAPGMKRREENHSMYIKRYKFISWTVEWLFPEVNVRRVDHRVKETEPIRTILAKHIEERPGNALERHQIKPLCDCGLANLLVYIKKVDVPASQTVYYAIDTTQPLSTALSGKTIIEFPSLIVRTTPPDESVKVIRDDAEVAG
ncbi:hypothetical protein HK104_000876, partial [Borealophlyctis nickersoniae]